MSSPAQAHHADLLAFGRRLSEGAPPDEEVLPGRVVAPPLRSVLYVPGNRRDWIRKCHRYGADAIVLDLEDSVPPDERPAARAILAEEIGPLAQRVGSVWVRVNAAPDSLPLDLAAAVRPGIHVVQLPKVFAPGAVQELDRALGWHEGRAGLPFGSVVVSPILETAGGVRRAHEICMASRRIEYVGAVVAPEGDTARALHLRVMHDAAGTETVPLRSQVAIDARAAGVQHVTGGTVTDLDPQHAVLRAFCGINRAMGYSGMLVIHPSHVPVVNELFAPTAAELARAVAVLRLLMSHPDRAAVRNAQGQMVDLAHARHAHALLTQAQALGLDF
ncbi:MAG: HpcH/HpaI aldolase/citrate lyase family protein [Aquabacterium sp.]